MLSNLYFLPIFCKVFSPPTPQKYPESSCHRRGLAFIQSVTPSLSVTWFGVTFLPPNHVHSKPEPSIEKDYSLL